MAFLSGPDILTIVTGSVSCILLYCITVAVYRIYFHPLSQYPGPRLWAASHLPWTYYMVQGTLPFKVHELHERYGPVVRLRPTELSFNQEEAWQDIYGKSSPRNTQLRKDPTQFMKSPTGVEGLLSEPDNEEHARMRRMLAHGFSEKALRDQEPIMTRYFDLFIQRLHENSANPVNLVQWLNFTTFDIIGDLTFGESFDCLEASTMHSWIALIFQAARVATLFGLSTKFSPLDKILLALLPASVREGEKQHRGLTNEKLLRRLNHTEPRTDFLVHAHTQLDKPGGISYEELVSTSGVMIVAGSETTASLLSGITFHLLTNPRVLAKLTEEVRNKFKSESEITITNVNRLTYALAVLNEGLRIYPPAPGAFPRLTPTEGCQIAGNYISGNTTVSIPHWATYHSDSNFKRPFDFIPERWLGDEEFKDDKRKAVNPFSVGPRNCLGRNLAYAEMRVILARMIWNFDMELCEESKDWTSEQRVFIIFQKEPLMVKLTSVLR